MMNNDKTVRKPKQARSIGTKERILETALKLFCEKGYYRTTTNEIARVAGVSIGSLYSYFKDKDTIFMEILGDYNKLFISVHEESSEDIELFRTDKRAWLRRFIEDMIKVHEISKELNQEMKILSFSNPEVASIREKQLGLTRKITMDFFYQYKDEINVKDIEAAAIVSYNFITSTVDYVVFEKNEIERDRILEATVEAICKFLLD